MISINILLILITIYLFLSKSSIYKFIATYFVTLSAFVFFELLSSGDLSWLLFPFISLALFSLLFGVKSVRQNVIVKPIFNWVKKILPPISKTEKEAIDAGSSWFEQEIFSGEPCWNTLRSYPKPKLSEREQKFLDRKVDKLCAMIDDWQTTEELHDLAPEIWEYLKQEKFFAMIIPSEYGGLEFTPYANSTIVQKIASKSLTAAVTVMVPNSLGPAELLLHYGSQQQKEYYLPRLANGSEIPCFALTGVEAGSDAGSIPDQGIVAIKNIDGKETLGFNLTINKRYITLAPVATVMGVAFKLYDPDSLLGGEEELGITLCLLPTNYPGINIGDRHIPLNQAFMNGPVTCENVFIPMEYIIGGQQYIGKGWRMLVECLSVGRGISLPALGAAVAKVSYLTSGSYAYVREQFKTKLSDFEGIKEQLAKIAGLNYLMEAHREFTLTALNLGENPSVVSAIAKYHMTEMSRDVINAAMDIHAGKAIILGPSNYLGRWYQGIPISITVEGANILTRTLMIFGQGAIRSHPYLLKEMLATMGSGKEALDQFDSAFGKHFMFATSNILKLIIDSLSFKLLIPNNSGTNFTREVKAINYYSRAFATISDFAFMLLGGSLKRRESLSARLGDALSYLYMSFAVIRFYEKNEPTKASYEHAKWCLEYCLLKVETALYEFCSNFDNWLIGRIIRTLVFPLGKTFKEPSDKLGFKLVDYMTKDREFRSMVTPGVYQGSSEDEALWVIEHAHKLKLELEPQLKLIKRAEACKKAHTLSDKIEIARQNNLINDNEYQQLQIYDNLRLKVINVDSFSKESFFGKKGNYVRKS